MYKDFHPKSDLDRLYLPKQVGGRGLEKADPTIQAERPSLNEYTSVRNDSEPMLETVWSARKETTPTISKDTLTTSERAGHCSI
jgi:hypothetical protein